MSRLRSFEKFVVHRRGASITEPGSLKEKDRFKGQNPQNLANWVQEEIEEVLSSDQQPTRRRRKR